jgi:hypothetical protein
MVQYVYHVPVMGGASVLPTKKIPKPLLGGWFMIGFTRPNLGIIVGSIAMDRHLWPLAA